MNNRVLQENAKKLMTKEPPMLTHRRLQSLLTQLFRFILVFLANQRFVFLICFTVFYKF